MDNNLQTKPRRLGRGLASLLADPVAVSTPIVAIAAAVPTGASDRSIERVAVNKIVPGRFQPRRHFDKQTLAALAESIKSAGVMQPILLRRNLRGEDHTFELIAGERRWRASQIAGLAEIPAIVVELSDVEAAQWGLIENLQREDLGTMERSVALAALARDFRLTHAEIAERVGLDRSTVTNFIRLTELEPRVQALMDSGRLSMGHGRALLAVSPGETRIALAEKAAVGGWTVRRLEQMANSTAAAEAAGAMPTLAPPTADELISEQARTATIREMERRLQEHLGTKVAIRTDRSGRRGRVVLRFYGLDQFEGMLARMGLNPRI